MDQESQRHDGETREVEAMLRSLTPAACDVPEETVMYRCGFEAGRRSVSLDTRGGTPMRRWHELVLAVCFVALMVGPAGYWLGQQRNSILTNSDLPTVTDKRDSIASRPVADPGDSAVESGNSHSIDQSTQESDLPNHQSGLALERATSSWLAQQLARLLPSNSRHLGMHDGLSRSSYLTSRSQLGLQDFNRELTRLELSRAGDRNDEGAREASNHRSTMMTPWTPFSGEVTTQTWEGLIQ